MTDWVTWHGAYDDPTSSLARRLEVVRQRVRESMDALGGSARRVLSLCAGDGRDVIPELAARPRPGLDALLVEQDGQLSALAAAHVARLGVQGVTVRTADAALRTSYIDVVPVDLLLLCGIFGNVPDEDIRRTVSAVPAILAPGGIVIWTRGVRDGADLRPTVRRWFAEAGLEEIAYDGEPELFGVGVARVLESASPDRTLPDRLFTFIR